MFLQTDKAHDGTSYRTSPDEDKETPTPVALFTQRYQSQWRIATRDMPVDGSMIPLTQTLLPLGVVLHRVVKRRGYVRA